MPLKIVDRAKFEELSRSDYPAATTAPTVAPSVAAMSSAVTTTPVSQNRNIVKRPRAIIPKPKQSNQIDQNPQLSTGDYLDNYYESNSRSGETATTSIEPSPTIVRQGRVFKITPYVNVSIFINILIFIRNFYFSP